MTVLDRAHAAMEAGGVAERLRFFERLADAELILLLERPVADGRIVPKVFPLEAGPVVLCFDTEERLVEAAGEAIYATLPGRALVRMIAGDALGLGLNLGVAPSAFLLDAPGVVWLADALAGDPEARLDRPAEVAPPGDVPQPLVTALDAKFAGLAGAARAAWLAAATYSDGRKGHILAFSGAAPGAEEALARAVREALVFSGLDAATLDVAMVEDDSAFGQSLARVALRFDLPQPPVAKAPTAPGTDPARPPKLR